jgi:hypothetical protein
VIGFRVCQTDSRSLRRVVSLVGPQSRPVSKAAPIIPPTGYLVNLGLSLRQHDGIHGSCARKVRGQAIQPVFSWATGGSHVVQVLAVVQRNQHIAPFTHVDVCE